MLTNIQRDTEEYQYHKNAQLMLITGMVPALIAYLDSEYLLRFANESYTRWFKVKPEDIIGRHLRDVIGGEAWHEIQHHIDRALAGEYVTYEKKIHYLNAPTRWIHANYAPDRDASGHVRGIVALINDVTATKQIEETLQQSRQEYQALLNNTPAILYRYSDRQGGLYYSPRVTEFLGYTPEYLLVNPLVWHDSIHADDLAIVDAAVGDLKAGKGYDLDYRIRDRNGEWHWFHDRSISHLLEDGELVVDGIAEDITLRKQAEEELQAERCLLAHRVEERTEELTRANRLLVQEIAERKRTMSILQESEERTKLSETLLRSVTDGVTDGIFVKDRAGRYVFANPAIHKVMNEQPGALLGKTVSEFLPDPVGRNMEAHEQLLMDADCAEMVEEAVPTAEGVRSFQTMKAPRHNSDGDVIGLIGIARDITDRKWAEETLAEQRHHDRLNMELVLAGARERRRVSAVLHDQIGQNLLLQKLKLRILEDTDTLIAPEAVQMLSEIRELLDETIAGVRSLTLQIHPPILATLGLTAAVDWLGKKIKSDYNLDVDITDDGAPKPLDQEQREVVYQAIRELLINITKHARTDRAQLLLSRAEERLVVVVADQGCGYNPAVKPGSSSGDGYGLHFIRRNVEYFGGTMTIESEPGQGTRITLYFPILTT